MTYSIIGSGAIGTAVARHFARKAMPVMVANERGPASLTGLVGELGPSILPSEVTEALKADLVILAVPFEAVFDIVKGVENWNGRIVVDATNAIDYADFSPKDLGGRPSSHVIAEATPGARIVKAFNHTWARILGRTPEDNRGRRVLFLSGDDAAANKAVANLVESWGFHPIDLGPIAAGGLLMQFGGPLTTLSLISQPIGGASLPEMDLLNP